MAREITEGEAPDLVLPRVREQTDEDLDERLQLILLFDSEGRHADEQHPADRVFLQERDSAA